MPSTQEVRIISGHYKGRKLTIKDPAVKPTPDRVRETFRTFYRDGLSILLTMDN